MKRRITKIALLVEDYDDAIDFYVRKLGFILLEDNELSSDKRWVVVQPEGQEGCAILLAKAANEEQKQFVGNQSGGRVFLFMETDDFNRDYQNLLHHNIKIIRQPQDEPYGTVAVFADLYGNLWDLIEPAG